MYVDSVDDDLGIGANKNIFNSVNYSRFDNASPRARDNRQRGVSRLRVPKDRLFSDFEGTEKNRSERV